MTRSTCVLLLLGCVLANARPVLAAPPSRPEQEEAKKLLASLARYLETDTTRVTRLPIPGDAEAGPAMTKLLEIIPKLPEGDETRLAAIALARKFANVQELLKNTHQTVPYNRQAHVRLSFAWHLMLKTGILYDGLPLEQATALLGKPTLLSGKRVEWYYNSTMHVNPGLHATLQDKQRLGSIQVIRK